MAGLVRPVSAQSDKIGESWRSTIRRRIASIRMVKLRVGAAQDSSRDTGSIRSFEASCTGSSHVD